MIFFYESNYSRSLVISLEVDGLAAVRHHGGLAQRLRLRGVRVAHTREVLRGGPVLQRQRSFVDELTRDLRRGKSSRAGSHVM